MGVCIFGGRTGTRTLDPLIKSQLLYQLSYASRTINLRDYRIFSTKSKMFVFWFIIFDAKVGRFFSDFFVVVKNLLTILL